jgi:hypothetical protein
MMVVTAAYRHRERHEQTTAGSDGDHRGENQGANDATRECL